MINALVVHNTHPDEWPNFERMGLPLSIDREIGNPDAYRLPIDLRTGRKPRMVNDENVNILGPGRLDGSPGQRQAYKLIQKGADYDLVVSIHGTELPDGECAVYGQNATPLVRGFASWLFPKANALIAQPGHLAFYRDNWLDVELSPNGDVTLEVLKNAIVAVAKGYIPKPKPIQEFASVGSVREESGERWGFRRRYASFEPLGRLDNVTACAYLEIALGTQCYAYGWDADKYAARTRHWGQIAVLNSQYQANSSAYYRNRQHVHI